MANYVSNHTGAQIDAAVENVGVLEGKVTTLSEEKIDKHQGADKAEMLMYVDGNGNVSQIALGSGLKLDPQSGKNIFHGEWESGRWSPTNGEWQPVATFNGNMGVHLKFPVMPGGTYTISNTKATSASVLLYVNEYSENDAFITRQNYVKNFNNTSPGTFTVSSSTYYISVDGYGNGQTLENQLPEGVMIEAGEKATAYEPYTAGDNVLSVRGYSDIIASMGVSSVPTYYLASNYLTNKCARVRELAESCAGNGDFFAFVTDQHWTLNAQQSPALIEYIAKKTYMPRVFSGGDTADQASEGYAVMLADAFSGDIHHAMGNHDYMGGVDGNKLAYIFDMGKSNQVGNAQRHYYYVDNPQQKIRYIVLSAFDDNAGTVVSAYEATQIEWLTNTALNVESGWTVIVFTHCLYYGNASDTTLTAWPDGASSVVSALDAAECDVACVIQGHMHLDRICHTPGGIPVVATTCDKYSPWISDGTDMEPWLSTRVEGTITEQAFDVVVLDKAQRQLTFVRIGAPADNWTDGTSTGTVEERVVTY